LFPEGYPFFSLIQRIDIFDYDSGFDVVAILETWKAECIYVPELTAMFMQYE